MKAIIKSRSSARKLNGVLTCALVVVGFLFALSLTIPRAAAQGVPANTSPLDSWSFGDTNGWVSDYGFAPVSFTNLGVSYYGDPINGSGLALVLDSTNAAWLQYNVYDSGNTTNLTVSQGSVTLWFSPDWGSTNAGGSGPGWWGQLIDVGQWTTNASYGWWSLYTDPAGANLYFSAQNNSGTQTNYLSAPISWTPGQWHFIALTYSAAHTSLYLDGQLATNGVGMSIWPNGDVLDNGFYIGSDTNGEAQAHGMFDELYTYNFVLDSNTVSGTFNSFQPGFYLLDSWSFWDTNGWTSDLGYAPVSFTNLAVSDLGDAYSSMRSVVVDSTNAAWLQYNVVETNGRQNLTVNQGTITMWFAPDWASTNTGGFGPGGWGQLINVGQWTSDASYGWWSLYTDPAGENLYFSAQDGAGTQTNYLSVPISWTFNAWHFIALTYSATNTALYLDGQLATNGVGVSVLPGTNVLANGFYIGSDTNGAAQAHGIFDDIYTYGIPLSSNAVVSLYANEKIGFGMNPYNFASDLILSAQSSTYTLSSASPTNMIIQDVFTGLGNLQDLGPSTNGCMDGTNAYNVWITNVVATMVGSGTNATMNLQFSIEGGSNNVPFDVFANSLLDFSTNTNKRWAWEGQGYQCKTYLLTNLPITTCFLILGTPQDTDGDGLTDAYELLVSKTSPTNYSTDGTGMADGWEILYFKQIGVDPNGDPDGDGLNNYTEFQMYSQGYSPVKWDSSTNSVVGDGYQDFSGDGLANLMEASFGGNMFTNNPAWKANSSGDGFPDEYKTLVGLPSSATPAPGLPTYSKNPIQ